MIKHLIAATLLLLPLCVSAQDKAVLPSADYQECVAVILWMSAAKHVNNGGVPDGKLAKVPEGWDVVESVANTKSPMMIICR